MRFGKAAALHQPFPGAGGNKYRTFSWVEYRDAVAETACGLLALGLRKGDVVALYSETRAEFYIADLGIMTAGMVAAALYISYPTPDQARKLADCDAQAVVVEDPKALAGLRCAVENPRRLQWILLTGEAEGAVGLDQLRTLGREFMAREPNSFERILASVEPADPAILYMTSGATGEPKMALVPHGALVANANMGPVVLPLTQEDRGLVFLPSAHIAQRVVMELVPIPLGLPVWFSESLSRLPHEMKSIRPTFLLAPPRMWERIYASICTEIRKRPAVTRKLFHGALGIGLQAVRLREQGKPVPSWLKASLAIADRLVFRKIRARFGGRLRIPGSGAAPLGADLARFYAAIGMPLIEGYGLTEGGIVSLNPVDRPRIGSIGTLLPGVEAKLGEDGELQVKSPCLFSGYYKDPAGTAEVIRDGWLATGDVAEIDPDGYLRITGRKKEMIISSNGKKIYPSRIENLFKAEPLINQVLLVGDRRPYVTALFTVNPALAETVKGMERNRGRPMAELAKAEPLRAELKKLVAAANQRLAPFEQIRKYRVLERDFTFEQGELTPTMKIRRARVLENFREMIEEMYA